MSPSASLARFDAVGWLAEQSLLALALGLIALAVERALRRRPALLLLLWGAVLLRFLLPAGLSYWRLPELPPATDPAWPAAAVEPAGPSGTPASPPSADRLPAAATGLWAAGALAVALRWRRARRRCRRLVETARPAGVEGRRILARLARPRRGRRRDPELLVSDGVTTPFAWGLLRPTIVLPASFEGADRRSQEAVLAHELAHLQRRDDLWLLGEALVCSLFFFHPIAWIAARRAALARELLCDARALGRLGDRQASYAAAVLAFATGAPGLAASALSSDRRCLEMRLRAILGPSASPRPWLFTLTVAVALLLLGLGPPNASVDTDVTEAELVDPLPGARVSWAYGQQIDPFSGDPKHHDGIDLVADRGTPVVAPAPGRVRRATLEDPHEAAWGAHLMIDHGGGLSTFYAHLESVAVESGQTVAAGETIATVGSSGRSTGPHLHFEVLRNGAAIDPSGLFPQWAR